MQDYWIIVSFVCGFCFACFLIFIFRIFNKVSNDYPDVESTLVFKTNKMTVDEKKARFSVHMKSLDELKSSRDIETDSVIFSVEGRELIEDQNNFPYKIVVRYWLEDDYEEIFNEKKL